MSFKRDGDDTNLLKSLNVSLMNFILLFIHLNYSAPVIYSPKSEEILLKIKI